MRDRDDEALGTVGQDLVDKSVPTSDGFHPRKWARRYIESYLIVPRAIAAVTGQSEADVKAKLAEEHGIAVAANFTDADAPPALLDVRAKGILRQGPTPVLTQFDASPLEVAQELRPDEICDDIKTFLADIRALR